MVQVERKIRHKIAAVLARGKSVLLLGPRQTGKTTLMRTLSYDRAINFSDPRLRQRYERDPGMLIQEVSSLAKEQGVPLITIDEVQKVPLIMDSAQYLIDEKVAIFVLTGSSARKLKRGDHINLLPGRVVVVHMDALLIEEIPEPKRELTDLLLDGSLPEIVLTDEVMQREELLEAYAVSYLEEEVRAEALVRNLGHFSHFLELAASEAGYPMNMHKLSQQIGVAAKTVESYYQVLEDCLIIERIEPITESKTRHRLNKSQKNLFYDLGVRRLVAREGRNPPLKYWGHLFEQFVGIELVRMSRYAQERAFIRYWSDANGPEVDWVVQMADCWIPIEVKWSDQPTAHDARHLLLFLNEYEKASYGYVVCRSPYRMQLADNVTAIPWQELATLLPTG